MYTQSERDDMERLFDKLRYVGYVLLALHLLLNFPEIWIYINREGLVKIDKNGMANESTFTVNINPYFRKVQE